MTAGEATELPRQCPSWCDGPAMHLSGLEEGCDLAESSQHRGPEYYVRVSPLAGNDQPAAREVSGVTNVYLKAEHSLLGGLQPMIEVRLASWEPAAPSGRKSEAMLPLTSGEARSLARQLERLADLVDLEP